MVVVSCGVGVGVEKCRFFLDIAPKTESIRFRD